MDALTQFSAVYGGFIPAVAVIFALVVIGIATKRR
jgi:hypothetical protein